MQKSFSLFIFQVHEVSDGFESCLLLKRWGESFVHDLEESGICDPHGLDEHLAELHGQYDWFKVTQRGDDIDKGMDESEDNGQYLVELMSELFWEFGPEEVQKQ